MFVRFDRLRDLRFSQLSQVYFQPLVDRCDQHLLDNEQMFYQYLHDVFFKTENAFYAVWLEAGEYVSALRLEPYKDGYLLAGLQTHCKRRNNGYAESLVGAVIDNMKECNKYLKIYAHVKKDNVASIRVHEHCGFKKIADLAVYIDGSVASDAYTFCYISE